jgi:hypothetical protein
MQQSDTHRKREETNMNRLMTGKWTWIEGGHPTRTGWLASLTDADLAFNPGGQAMTLGELYREMGEIQHTYTESLKLFKQDFSYRHPDPSIATRVDRLKAWFAQLDDEMKNAVSALSDADVDTRTIERGFPAGIEQQLDIYLQALLIFAGKLSIYWRIMNKPLPQNMVEWIG